MCACLQAYNAYSRCQLLPLQLVGHVCSVVVAAVAVAAISAAAAAAVQTLPFVDGIFGV